MIFQKIQNFTETESKLSTLRRSVKLRYDEKITAMKNLLRWKNLRTMRTFTNYDEKFTTMKNLRTMATGQTSTGEGSLRGNFEI